MRPLNYLLILTLFFASCKLPQYGETNHTAPDPYVELKDGTTKQAETVEIKHGVFGTSIIADGNKYKPKEVAFFSTGNAKFACIGRKPLICPEVVQGKINLYRQLYEEVDMKTGMSHTRAIYFMQAADSKEVSGISYSKLNKIIPSDAPAHSYLERYNKTRKFTATASWACVGAIVGGAVVIGSSPALGAAALGAGVVGLFSFTVAKMVNRRKLYKAIEFYNKSE